MTIRTVNTNGVAVIEIARPEKKNALTQAMYTAMSEAIVAADADPAIRWAPPARSAPPPSSTPCAATT